MKHQEKQNKQQNPNRQMMLPVVLTLLVPVDPPDEIKTNECGDADLSEQGDAVRDAVERAIGGQEYIWAVSLAKATGDRYIADVDGSEAYLNPLYGLGGEDEPLKGNF